ncbi:MAG: cation-translocating P-type ATPase [Cellulosilyticum sp.]|nr:cation-translocating P-type ATPase [Cellulosilyticum sp.]
MKAYAEEYRETLNRLKVDESIGLNSETVIQNRAQYGENKISVQKKKGLISKVFESLREPMVIILLVAAVITIGVNIMKYLGGYETEFIECIGIIFAIILTVTITLVMEGRSEKAFERLNQMKEDIEVKVIREGNVRLINQSQVVVGDLVLVSTGDKLIADGRLIETHDLKVDESMLTGESHLVHKDTQVCKANTVIAERTNMLYSGSFVMSGNGKMVITEVGKNTEFGKIAEGLIEESEFPTPLQQKLNALSKTIALIGASIAGLTFILQLIGFDGQYTLEGISEAFIASIVLIVACVPEGLSTIVAASLAINVIKLAKQNTLVKKMVACETIGSTNIICSDKTGTLTQNKMTAIAIDGVLTENNTFNPYVLQNICLNSTADLNINDEEKKIFIGNPTEGALLVNISGQGIDYRKIREQHQVLYRQPFSSETKQMTTVIEEAGHYLVLMKGSPEKILSLCKLSDSELKNIQEKMEHYQRKACRLIAFCHQRSIEPSRDLYLKLNKEVEIRELQTARKEEIAPQEVIEIGPKEIEKEQGFIETYTKNMVELQEMIYDGFAAITDPLRAETFDAVSQCIAAGIELKMLTGDNRITAEAIAKELQILKKTDLVVEAKELEDLDDDKFEEVLSHIRVIARSTPMIKMRVVNTLRKLGNVVAVTGDGINDAPALKHADIGIAMGIAGTEVSKEASDMVLLDDSFSTIVKAVEWGRGLYDNFQRFIQFQLTVNLASVLVVLGALILGYTVPFTPLQLLWINIIMDGPPALSLGLEPIHEGLMKRKPIKRTASIVSKNMIKSIIRNGIVITFICLLQHKFNFIGGTQKQQATILFTLFTVCQLFNALNSRKLGSESISKYGFKNRKLFIVLGITFILQIFITQFGGNLFHTIPLGIEIWMKIVVVGIFVLILDELIRWIERKLGLEIQEFA